MKKLKVTRIINIENQGQMPKEGSIGYVLPTVVVGLPEEKDEHLIIREEKFDVSKIIEI